MIKRIVYLAIPLIIVIGVGLMAVQNLFSSFPPSKTVIDKFSPSANIPPAIDLTESFFDDSGSMKGYYSKQYIKFLRTLKSHIREKGKYQYYAFSDPENTVEGDPWKVLEDVRFYCRNNTYFDKVLASISDKIVSGNQTAKNFLIITDGIQDVSGRQDYSRIVNRVSDLLDSGLIFQIIAIKLPFSGHKYPEGGSYIPYQGASPLFCYVFSYQSDFGKDLYRKLHALDLPVKFLEFGNTNIHASVKKYRDSDTNRDGSRNSFRRFKDVIPVTYLMNRTGTGGTLLANIALTAKGVGIDNSGFMQRTPEFCGKCLAMGDNKDVGMESQEIVPSVTVTASGVEPLSHADGSLEISYSFLFNNWEKDPKTLACDLTLCNWLPVNPPDWIDEWSSDCDNSRQCFEGKTPFLNSMINPILTKSLRKYTFGYAVIRN